MPPGPIQNLVEAFNYTPRLSDLSVRGGARKDATTQRRLRGILSVTAGAAPLQSRAAAVPRSTSRWTTNKGPN